MANELIEAVLKREKNLEDLGRKKIDELIEAGKLINIFLTKDESETKIADYTKKFPIEYQALYDTAIALRKRPKFPSVPETAIPLSDLPFDVEITKKDRARVISLIQTQPSPNIKDRYYRFNFLK